MPAHRTRDTTTRTLEVATDAPLPPTVAIISPTPRAFTFPFDHDAPYAASPSSSPFEPDLKHPAATPPPIRALSPTSSIGSDSSSLLSTPSAPPSQASHKRRRSTASDIGERRPKKGDEDYIKRPENAFILFRRKCCEERQALDEADDMAAPVKKQRQADLSKTISQQWKSLSAEERLHWEELAKEKKKEHEALYPNYVYRPQRVKAKAKKGKGRRVDGEQETDAESSISFVLPVPSPPRSLSRDYIHSGRGHGRRAASAPTPPPAYQMIQLPTVHMPSCPGSPSRVPRISRRSPFPHVPPPTGLDSMTHFEYLPNDTLFPPSFQHASYEPSLESNELYSHMFSVPSQPGFVDRSNDRPLHSLSIPRESAYASSNLVSPAESVGSSAILSPVDSYSSALSPSSPRGAPFTPAEAISMMSLSLSHPNEYVEGVPECVSMELSANEMAYTTCDWSEMWPQGDAESMIPDDFDLSAIPPIEFGMASLDGDMQQQLDNADLSSGFPQEVDFDSAEFASGAEGNDFHDTTPGHDPFPGLFGYEGMNW